MDERQAYAAVTGQVVCQLRTLRRLSQEALASRAGLSQSALSRFEKGQTLPDAYEVRALAVALGQTPQQFMERIEEGFARTRDAAKKVSSGSPLEAVAAGVLVGLAMAGVAAMLEEVNKKNARKKS
jgi:transcriptional regulator with XRE-family HTH domain